MLKVRVPATTANLGPGFDALGLALDIYNTVTVMPSEKGVSLEIKGEGEQFLPLDENNLLIKAAQRVFDKAGYNPGGLFWVQENRIPLESGMGSSAAAIVAGVCAANALLPRPFSEEEITDLAVQIEGHPDNIAPALFGGLTISYPREEDPQQRLDFALREGCENGFGVIRTGVPPGLHLVLAVPETRLSTKKSRGVLPRQVSFEDAAFNVGRTAALVASLMNGQGEHLKEACRDRLHQPYRFSLMPGVDKVVEAALRAGAQGCALSGAGPSVAAYWVETGEGSSTFRDRPSSEFAPSSSADHTTSTGRSVASAMQEAFAAAGTGCRIFPARPDAEGTVIL